MELAANAPVTDFPNPNKEQAMRKRVLIVNTFFDEYRRTSGSPYRIPSAMGPVYLAGALNPATVEVRLYNEQYSGPLLDPALLAWPDLLVLTGLTSSFDRMLHLTGYARALNHSVIVAAGGPAVRALPRRAAEFFDYASTGDIEALRDIASDALGPDAVAGTMFPRFDLADKHRLVAYVESSRNCNFRCSFCSLTGEKVRYQHYDLGFLERQLLAVGRKHIVLIDNNFYGNDRSFFEQRVALLGDFYRKGRINSWSALVTGDFFARDENLPLVRNAGCLSLFSGVESFDDATLRTYNKKHNTLQPQTEMIKRCLDAGVLFIYGVMLDPSSRTLAALRNEIRYIVDRDDISLPAYFTLAIPMLGTPYFKACADAGLLLPRLRLRDLDGVTLGLKPLDPIDEAAKFARDLLNLRGYRLGVLRHFTRFTLRYGRTLSPLQLFVAGMSGALIATESTASSPTALRLSQPNLTYFAPTETLDPLYEPAMPLPAGFERYFKPTMVTDSDGRISTDILGDLRIVPSTPLRMTG
jgi:hopanoid C-2 methylase